MNKPYLVGVTGGSAAGKSYLLEALEEAFSPQQLTLVAQDHYYRDRNQIPLNEWGEVNYDHPDSMDLELFEEHIRLLLQGQSVSIREYTYNNPGSEPRIITYHPAPLVVAEGIFMFHKPSTSALCNLRIYIDAHEHVKLARRLRRDLTERQMTLETVLADYERYVAPMFKRYVEPHRHECHLVLPNNQDLHTGSQVVVHHLRQVLAQWQPNGTAA